MKSPRHSVRLPCIFVALLFCMSGIAKAETLATYQFANANATTQATDVVASAAAWSFTATVIGFGGGAQSAYVRSDVLGTAYDAGEYLTVTLSAADGKVLNLSSFAFDFGGNTSTGSSAILSTEVRASTGAEPFSAPLTISPVNETTATHTILTTDSTTRYTSLSIDLTAAEFQGVESIGFRFYVAASSPSNTRFLRFDNFTIEGAVATAPIPEPSSVALLGGVAVLGLVVCKRRRSK